MGNGLNTYKYSIKDTKNFVGQIKDKIDSGLDFKNIDLSDIISQFNNLDETVVKAAQDAQASGGGFGIVTTALDKAGEAAARSQNKLKTVGTIFKTVGAAIANAAASYGVSLLLEAVGSAVTSLIQHNDDMGKSAQQIGSEFKNTASEIEQYKEQVTQQYNTINSSTSSIEDVTAARENLLNIQNQMIEAYGSLFFIMRHKPKYYSKERLNKIEGATEK